MLLMVRFCHTPLYPRYLRSHYSITHTLSLSALKVLSSCPIVSNKTIFEMKLLSHGSDSQNIANREEIFGGVSIEKRIVTEGTMSVIYREIQWIPQISDQILHQGFWWGGSRDRRHQIHSDKIVYRWIYWTASDWRKMVQK